MRKTLLFFLLLSVKLTFGQVLDDFSDGDFVHQPGWIGHTNRFKINSSKQLQSLLTSDNQSIALATKHLLTTNVSWEFTVQLNFDPSTNNQAKIYLMADQPDLTASLNGYFIQIGESGSEDSYDLYQQTGTVITKVLDGAAKPRANVNQLLAKIKVLRSKTGNWQLFTDVADGRGWVLEGTATDLTHMYTDWFGIHCKYTATRSDGFIFDDFKIEAISPDLEAPILLNVKTVDELTLEAVFSERLDAASALLPLNYRIGQLGNPISVSLGKTPNVVLLKYASAIQTGNYELMVNNLTDLSGNLIRANSAVSFFHLKPRQLQSGDILISEILVNPKTGGVDFVEIYNNSQQILDLQSLQLANANSSGAPANIKNVSNQSVYMMPETYWVLTVNPSDIKQRYNVRYPQQFVQMNSLPAFNNDKGTVILLTANGILERLNYDEQMHVALLRNADGVSLERISFNKAVNELGNFTSAAMAAGFATPTSKNSQAEEETVSKNVVHMPSRTFSPDGDGFEDILTIQYQFAKSGQFATVNIYNSGGLLVRKLQRNASVGTTGSFEWDGLDDNGQRSKIGIYIVAVDAFTLEGKTEKFRKSCVLAAKLN